LHKTDGRRVMRSEHNALDGIARKRRRNKAPHVPAGDDRFVNPIALGRCKRRLWGSIFICH
jgi:hypothetical protein